MYFDPTPKKKKEDLFGFDDEYSRLKKAMDNRDRLIVIKGLRRTGKTSLMGSVYKDLPQPRIFIDMREVAPLTQENFTKHFYAAVIGTVGTVDFFKAVIAKIKSVDFGIKITMRTEESTISLLLKNMNEALAEKKKTMFIFIDEAQLMKPILADNLFAYIYDHLTNIKIVFAGSEIGVLDRMLGDEKNALFGRPYLEIATKPMSNENAEKFLIAGFRQANFKISENEINKIIETTGTITGWLALAGFMISESRDFKEGLRKTRETAKKIILSELNGFFEKRKGARPRYTTILKLVSDKPLTWAAIKRGFEAKFGRISNNQITEYLHTLKEYGFIDQKERLYFIIDNLLADVLS